MTMLNLLKEFWNRRYLTFTEKLAGALYFIFILRLHQKESIQRQSFDFENLSIIFFGFLSILLLARLLSLLTRKWNWLHVGANLLFLATYTGISFYHLRSGIGLDYSIISDNINLLFYRESGGVIFDTFTSKDRNQLLILLVVLILIQWRWKKLSQVIEYEKSRLHRITVLAGYILIFHATPYSYEEYSAFLKTVREYYGPGQTISIPKEKYPYKRALSFDKKSDPPHIFIVTVESFNANAVNRKSRNGKEYTPFVNSLTKQGIYFEKFYGHSIQTAKGQFSIYCSLLPLTKKKVFVDFPAIGVKCLPHVLKKAGYTSYFFKAFSNINYDNTYNFALNMGFDHVYAMTGKFISSEEKKKYYWGWGIQDDLFYKKFFEYVDKNRGKRIFAALTTVSNHMKFKQVPENQRYIYPNKNDRYSRYANSIRVTDEYLKTFFSELKKRKYLANSVVIVTGDHSFPWGEHGIYSNENGYYDESFRTPLVIWGAGVSAKMVKERRSQVDIAPTIMDIVGVSDVVHFRGESFFRKSDKPIHLIQPYDGGYQAVVIGKYKYVYHKRTKREFCYDLDLDPKEEANIIDQMKGSTSYVRFLKGIEEIALNDYLIKGDRIWEK